MHARTANLMQLLTSPGSPVVMFRCECGDVNCRRTIPMSPVSFREEDVPRAVEVSVAVR
jgi:hypothetical protein